MLNLFSGICFVIVGIGLLLRLFGIVKLRSPERNATWLEQYGKQVKWLAPLCVLVGVFNIVWGIEIQSAKEQMTSLTQIQSEDEQMAREIAEDLSQGLPRRFSPDVILETVNAENATVTFKYKLEHSPSSTEEAKQAQAAIETSILNRFCSNNQFRQLMLHIPGRAILVFNDGSKYSEFIFSTIFEKCP